MARQQSKVDQSALETAVTTPTEPAALTTTNGHVTEPQAEAKSAPNANSNGNSSVQAPAPTPAPEPPPAPAEQHLPTIAPHVSEALKPLMVETKAEEVESGGWPPPLYLVPNASKSEVHYMKNRWQTQWLYYDKKASEHKRKHQALQVFIGVASVSVPVLLTASTSYPVLTLIASIVSASVAAAAAIENVKKYGDNWRSFRQAAEDLAREKSMYDVVAGPYRASKRPFVRFVERCEDIMSQQNGQFHQRGEENQPQTQAAASAPASSKDAADTG
jgi:hypothetical protein